MDRTIKKTMQHLRPRDEPAQALQLPELPSVPLRTVWLRRDKNGDDMMGEEPSRNRRRLPYFPFRYVDEEDMKTEYTKEQFQKGDRPGPWRYAEPFLIWAILLLLIGAVVSLIMLLIWWVMT